MSRAKAQRLLTEILTIYDGPPTVALQALISLLCGCHVLLSPRGHHFENLANALAWSFNGVIRKLPAGAPIDTGALLDREQISHVLLVEGLDSTRLVRLKSALRRAAAAESGPQEPLFILATADPADIPDLGHPDRSAWDETFAMRLNGRDSVQREPAAIDMEFDPLGIDQILPEDITTLRREVAQVVLPPSVNSALGQMPALLAEAGWPGLPLRAAEELGRTAQVVAFLRGKKEVNSSHVADMLHPVITARISSAEALPAGLLDSVEEAWDEISRVAVPGRQHVPQRKTFVGAEAELALPRASQPDDGTDPLVQAPAPPARPASRPASHIHGAYYAPPRSYKAASPGQPASASAEDAAEEAPEDEHHLPMFSGSASRRAAPSRFRSLGVPLISAGFLVAIAVLGTAMFPGWPGALRGFYQAATAQWQLVTEQYEPAEQNARQALERLGSQSFLSHRLETIELEARRYLRDRDRLAREAAARDAYRARRFEEAAGLYEQLARTFPDRPLYVQLAKEARKQLGQ